MDSVRIPALPGKDTGNFPVPSVPFPVRRRGNEADTRHGGAQLLCALSLDCVSGSTGGLLVVLAGGEEWGGIASFWYLPLSVMPEHSFRTMYIALFHESLM